MLEVRRKEKVPVGKTGGEGGGEIPPRFGGSLCGTTKPHQGKKEAEKPFARKKGKKRSPPKIARQ